MTVTLNFREQFSLAPETYWRELCLSLDYQRRLYREALGAQQVELVEEHGDFARGWRRRLRFTKPIAAPAAVRKLFGSSVTVEEQSEFEPVAQRWSYRIVPPLMADRIEIRGHVTLVAQAGGIEQRSESSVSCRMFGLGGILEPFVARSTEEGHADKTAFTRRYIAEKGLR